MDYFRLYTSSKCSRKWKIYIYNAYIIYILFYMTLSPQKKNIVSHPVHKSSKTSTPGPYHLFATKNPMRFGAKAALVGLELGCLSQLVQDTHLFVVKSRNEGKTPGEFFSPKKNSFFGGKNGGKLDVFTGFCKGAIFEIKNYVLERSNKREPHFCYTPLKSKE